MSASDRLAQALERISTALVRRAEADAAARDRDERETAAPAPDMDALDELRHRVDAAIERVRAALDGG